MDELEHMHDQNAYLMHYGVKGMKWGKRIFSKIRDNRERKRALKAKRKRNLEKGLQADGSKKRLTKTEIEGLTDKQLAARLDRRRKEKQLLDIENGMNPVAQKRLDPATYADRAITKTIDTAVAKAVNDPVATARFITKTPSYVKNIPSAMRAEKSKRAAEARSATIQSLIGKYWTDRSSMEDAQNAMAKITNDLHGKIEIEELQEEFAKFAGG